MQDIAREVKCEPLDKRLLIWPFYKPMKAEDFRPKRLVTFL